MPCETKNVSRRWPRCRRGFTQQPENSERAHLSVLALHTPLKFNEKTPQRGKKEWRGKKSAILGGPGEGPFGLLNPSGPHPSGPPPFGPSTLGALHPWSCVCVGVVLVCLWVGVCVWVGVVLVCVWGLVCV